MSHNNNVNITKRSLLVYGSMLFFALLIIVKLFTIQYVNGNKYRALAQKNTVKEFNIKATRGNIYADDGSVLATSVPNYDIYFDPTVVSSKVFFEQIDVLAAQVARFTGQSKDDLKHRLITARKMNKKYIRIVRGLNFSDFTKIKNFPIFKLGLHKGGFIPEFQTVRAYPFGDILKRTIGFDRGEGNRAGLEGAYADVLSGKDGMQKKQKIKYDVWKPLSDIDDVEPKDGNDIWTNINVDFQDVAHHALKQQLINFEADHGSLVVMEVQTGAIKTMVNLGKNKSGNYTELRNYAVFETHEPGSTFKLFSIMALLEDELVDENTKINTGNGIYEIYNKTVRDSHKGGMGVLTLNQVFEKSSNVGVTKMVYENYKDNSKKFVNRMYNFGIHQKTDIDLKGEGIPIIPDPKDKNWSGISLPWMSYGYGVELTDLQILTYYNAIANQGKVMQPYIVNKIKSFNKNVKEIKPQTLNNSIASLQTVKKMQEMLKGVVLRGTATNIKNDYVAIAGKTGTAQTEYWKGKGQYVASFVGYFPADNPKYSMIVVVHKPNPEKGYYGNIVAAPVFEKVAQYINGKLADEQKIVLNTIKVSDKTEKVLEKYKTVMPDLRGMSSKEALYILENMGLKVKMNGNGAVKKQSIARGERIKKNQLIELKLS